MQTLQRPNGKVVVPSQRNDDSSLLVLIAIVTMIVLSSVAFALYTLGTKNMTIAPDSTAGVGVPLPTPLYPRTAP